MPRSLTALAAGLALAVLCAMTACSSNSSSPPPAPADASSNTDAFSEGDASEPPDAMLDAGVEDSGEEDAPSSDAAADVGVDAAGAIVSAVGGGYSGSADMVHWDGSAWTVRPAPIGAGALDGLWGTAGAGLFAVGSGTVLHHP